MLGRNANGGIRLQMKDLATGAQIGPQLRFAASYQPVRLLELGEAGQGPALDVAVLGINGNGVYRAEIVDPISMERVAAIVLP